MTGITSASSSVFWQLPASIALVFIVGCSDSDSGAGLEPAASTAGLDVTAQTFPQPRRILLVGVSAGGYGTLLGDLTLSIDDVSLSEWLHNFLFGTEEWVTVIEE